MAISSRGLAAPTEPLVTNVRAAQRPGTIFVDITYDLEYAGPLKHLEASVALSEDGGATYTELRDGLTGDRGSVVAGKDKRVAWEAGVSWLGRAENRLSFKISVKASEMVWIAPGKFTMGSPAEEPGRETHEGPQTVMTLSRGFWLGRHEVRQREWEAVAGGNPSEFKGNGELPVDTVSWEEAMAYCRKLTERERAANRLPAGWEYRLPTEAQWEFACRAGTNTRYSFGDREADLDRYGWHTGNSGGRTHPVGQKEPNAWGLHDMHGNVWEWCLDWYGGLPGGTETDPTGARSGSYRVYRGGAWGSAARDCRSAFRFRFYPSFRDRYMGFRVALVQVP